jgi:transcriptional regulator with XRE-family HTH domain
MTPDELRNARKRLGMTQAQLARLLGIKSDRTIRRMEAGDVEISGPVTVLVELLLRQKAPPVGSSGADG